MLFYKIFLFLDTNIYKGERFINNLKLYSEKKEILLQMTEETENSLMFLDLKKKTSLQRSSSSSRC